MVAMILAVVIVGIPLLTGASLVRSDRRARAGEAGRRMYGLLKAWLWLLVGSAALFAAGIWVFTIPSDACGFFTCTEGYGILMILGAAALFAGGSSIIFVIDRSRR